MSSTNHTTNYNLSQFLGTDKPAWLGDYNSDMSKIDAGINTAQTTATGADGKADTNAAAIGTLTNLTTTDKTSLVAAINEVDTNADAAQGTANSAASTANSAATAANNIAAYITMTTYDDVDSGDITINAGSIGSKSVSYASNAAGTVGKIYGSIVTVKPTSASTIVTIANLPFNVTSNFTVKGIAYAQATNDKTLYAVGVNFKTNNTATLEFGAGFNGLTLNIYLNASLLFIQDFGDTPD